MRFSTVTFMAVAAEASILSTLTDYSTQLVTVTACPESVTNCPIKKSNATATSTSSSSVQMTTSTRYSTKVHTITSCAASVTDCPARSTIISVETIAAYTTVCPVSSASPKPIYSNSTMSAPSGLCGDKPCPPATATAEPTDAASPDAPETPADEPVETGLAMPTAPTAAPESVCTPSFSVSAVTKSYTTVLTSVEYETVPVPCPTQSETPAGSAAPLPTSNLTAPAAPITAGASSIASSAVLALAVGVAAVVFA